MGGSWGAPGGPYCSEEDATSSAPAAAGSAATGGRLQAKESNRTIAPTTSFYR